ncbi:MAG: septation protein IspZ [Rhodobacteraceae bacterium]|nr:septation protein IspZ [Paracoccaceae bacterium]
MTEKTINPMLKMALELGPVIVFFVVYLKIKDRTFNIGGVDYQGFIVATAGFIPLLIITTGIVWWLTGKIARMQIAVLVLVIVFGGLSIYFNDPQFFKMKPTILYLLFGCTLGFGLLRRKSYLKYVMEEVLPMADAGWMILTKRVTVLFFTLAIANEVIWRNMSEENWVYFKTFGLTAAVFIFFMSQSSLFQKYSLGDQDKK